MEELTLTVVYTSKPGMRQAFVEEVVARGILDKIRAEEGCIALRLLRLRGRHRPPHAHRKMAKPRASGSPHGPAPHAGACRDQIALHRRHQDRALLSAKSDHRRNFCGGRFFSVRHILQAPKC